MTSVDSGRWRLPRPAIAILDVLLLVAAVATVVVIGSGGFDGRLAGARVTANDPTRPAAAVVLLLATRLVFARRAGLFGARRGRTPQMIRGTVERDADRLPPGPSPTTRRTFALATLGYVLVATFMLHTQLRQMDSVPDLGDPLFSMWRIGWVQQQLRGDPRGLFDANIFHPEPLTLTYSDSMLLTSVAATPLVAAGLAPAVAYNVLLVVSFLLSALATWLLVARLTGSASAAFVAGVLYGFHPFRFEHYSHLELQMTYWMPLALLALHRFVDTRRFRDAMLAAGCMVGLLYSSMYFAVFFPFYVAAAFGTLLIVGRPPIRSMAGPLVIAGLLAGAAAVPLIGPYNAAQETKGERSLEEVEHYSATASDYFRAHFRSAMYGRRLLPATHGERQLFPGVVMIVLAAGALVPPIGAVRLAYLAGLALAFDMSMGLNGLLYPQLYEWFSPVRGMRVPARFSVILGISLAVLAGFTVRWLLARCRTLPTRRIVFGLIIAAAVVDLRPVLTLQPVWTNPPPVYAAVEGQDVVLAEFPFSIDGSINALPQMYFSIWHGRNMVNGYSGFSPPSYAPLLETIWQFPGPETLEMFRSRGVTHVTVTCALMPEPEPRCTELLAKIDTSPAFRRIAAARWEGHPSRLYELLD